MSSVLLEEASQPTASSSSPPRPLCAVCNHRYSIYTCPRCSARTCSLPCSTTHKANASCSGERNKAAYVPMNQYGWGAMMNDYTFLEDVGRKVGEWGSEIVRGGFGMRGAARGRGRGRGRGGGDAGGKTKRDALKMQLEQRDIDMDLLPAGMGRRRLNQSNWDYKNKTALLTIEFKFHRPPDPLASASQTPEPPFSLITHRNSLEKPLLTLIQSHVAERSKSKKDSAWVQSLVRPDPDDPEGFVNPQCVMAAQLDPLARLSGPKVRAYYKFDPLQTLSVLLRNTHFVEFPTIEIWEEFKGTIVDTKGTVTRYAEEERKPKRRKLDMKAGKKAISGLLGDYGSEDEEDEVEGPNILAMLDEYPGSDDDMDEGQVLVGDLDANAEIDTDRDEDEDEDEEVDVDPSILLELMRQSQWVGEPGEDLVDWGEDEPE